MLKLIRAFTVPWSPYVLETFVIWIIVSAVIIRNWKVCSSSRNEFYPSPALPNRRIFYDPLKAPLPHIFLMQFIQMKAFLTG
jgi:hypothetical protein